MPTITLRNVVKDYANGVRAVDDVSLRIDDGELMVLVGPSGCGKSTLLRMIAGLEGLTSGRVEIGGTDVTNVAPKHRDIAMVFQNYALYPHMTVHDNMAFGLRQRKAAKETVRARVGAAGRLLGLAPLLERRPGTLSGGQRQRVAMGRAMVREPRAFLMDEPLSNLDAALRGQMRTELVRLRDRLRTTTVYVTHDQVEAMTLGDRVAVMRDGVLQQVDVPQRLYRTPANTFVAAFIGSPPMNLVEAVVREGAVRFGGHAIPLPAGLAEQRDGKPLVVGLRPSDLVIDDAGPLRVVPDVVEDLGSEVHLVFDVDATPVRVASLVGGTDDDDAQLVHDERGRATFTARVDQVGVRAGDTVRLSIDPAKLHFFDAAQGHRVT
jgi:multiple sugar transport system ATP-binding protein